MRGTAENRPAAIFHQHEIGDIDRHAPAFVERVDSLEPGRPSALLGRLDRRFAGAEAAAFGDEFGKASIVRGEALRQRVVGRECEKRGAVERVGPRREDLDCLPLRAGDRERDARAFRAPDPILLHQPHPLGPAVEPRQRLQQRLGI